MKAVIARAPMVKANSGVGASGRQPSGPSDWQVGSSQYMRRRKKTIQSWARICKLRVRVYVRDLFESQESVLSLQFEGTGSDC